MYFIELFSIGYVKFDWEVHQITYMARLQAVILCFCVVLTVSMIKWQFNITGTNYKLLTSWFIECSKVIVKTQHLGAVEVENHVSIDYISFVSESVIQFGYEQLF